MVEFRNLSKLKLFIYPGFIGEWRKFDRKKNIECKKNVERKNIGSAIEAASVHPFTSTE
jgi:hypothetical protein